MLVPTIGEVLVEGPRILQEAGYFSWAERASKWEIS